MRVQHPIDAMIETYHALGGWKGLAVLAVIVAAFMFIVESAIPMRHTYNATYARRMKGKRKGQ